MECLHGLSDSLAELEAKMSIDCWVSELPSFCCPDCIQMLQPSAARRFWKQWNRSATEQSLTASRFRFARHLLLVALVAGALSGARCDSPSSGQLLLGLLTLELLLSGALGLAWRRHLLLLLTRSLAPGADGGGSGSGKSSVRLTPVRLQRRFRLLAALLLTAPVGGAAATKVDTAACQDDEDDEQPGQVGDSLLRLRRRARQAVAIGAAASLAALVLVANPGGGGGVPAAQPLLLEAPVEDGPGGDTADLLADLLEDPRLLRRADEARLPALELGGAAGLLRSFQS